MEANVYDKGVLNTSTGLLFVITTNHTQGTCLRNEGNRDGFCLGKIKKVVQTQEQHNTKKPMKIQHTI